MLHPPPLFARALATCWDGLGMAPMGDRRKAPTVTAVVYARDWRPRPRPMLILERPGGFETGTWPWAVAPAPSQVPSERLFLASPAFANATTPGLVDSWILAKAGQPG
ncbi:hypothetical protein ACJZ2D_006823 [Fusarium nematophilum]